MKTMKRMMSLLLMTLLLVSLLAVPASAVTGTYSIHIVTPDTNHTYEIYQIFKGDLNSSNILTNIVWGSGVTSAGQTAMGDAGTKAGSISTVAAAEEFGEFLGKNNYLNTSSKVTLSAPANYDSANGYYHTTVTEQGYYLIKDQNGTLTGDHAYTSYILKVAGNVEVSPKNGKPTLTKQVSKSEKVNYTDGISSCIGDTVYFALSASMHSGISYYEHYYLRFDDTMPTGLSYTAPVGLFIGQGSDYNTYTQIDPSKYTIDVAGQNFSVTVKDAQAASLEATGHSLLVQDKVLFIYSAEVLNTIGINAVEVGGGNINRVTLQFSNDPNEAYDPASQPNPSSMGNTAEMTADVYSYAIQMTKVDSVDNSKKLGGAQFIVYRYKGSSAVKEYLTFDANGYFTGCVDVDTNPASVVTTSSVDDATKGTLTLKGLSSGTYHFKEITPPSGYNLLTVDVSLTITGGINSATGNLETFEGSVTNSALPVTVERSTGTVMFSIANRAGTTLPSTGGMGTAVFYVTGAVLVLGAATLLLTKKRGTQK